MQKTKVKIQLGIDISGDSEIDGDTINSLTSDLNVWLRSNIVNHLARTEDKNKVTIHIPKVTVKTSAPDPEDQGD